MEKDAPVSRAIERPDAFFVAQFSAGYTTNMFGFVRQGQPTTDHSTLSKSAQIRGWMVWEFRHAVGRYASRPDCPIWRI